MKPNDELDNDGLIGSP